MRINFGASSAIVRLQTGYYSRPMTPILKPSEEPSKIYQNNGTFYQLKIGFEAMVMVNNRFHFAESVSRRPPRFLTAKLNHDGTSGIVLSSVSFAQSLKCRAFFPLFGQIKGYWSTGIALRISTLNPNSASKDPSSMIGGRLAFNSYNKTSAMQAELCAFKGTILANVLIFRKIGKNILLHGGSEFNHPTGGLSLLFGSCRLAASTRIIDKRLQHGLMFTANL